eukprot:Colp12_sorted_trinity150504_noHs@24048
MAESPSETNLGSQVSFSSSSSSRRRGRPSGSQQVSLSEHSRKRSRLDFVIIGDVPLKDIRAAEGTRVVPNIRFTEQLAEERISFQEDSTPDKIREAIAARYKGLHLKSCRTPASFLYAVRYERDSLFILNDQRPTYDDLLTKVTESEDPFVYLLPLHNNVSYSNVFQGNRRHPEREREHGKEPAAPPGGMSQPFQGSRQPFRSKRIKCKRFRTMSYRAVP